MPQAWLIRTIDTDDSTEPSPWPVPTCSSPTCARGDSGHIAAADAHVAMGFEPVPGAVHTFYDGQTPTAVFAQLARGWHWSNPDRRRVHAEG